MQVTSTFWATTRSIPRAELATIPPMKEEMHGFHMTQNLIIYIHLAQVITERQIQPLGGLTDTPADTPAERIHHTQFAGPAEYAQYMEKWGRAETPADTPAERADGE